MSLRERLSERIANASTSSGRIFETYGFRRNPFPPSSQTNGNPHAPTAANEVIDQRIVSFMRDHRSQVVVIEGSQGVGKTNLLNYYEQELTEILSETEGFYLVRYLSDPEASFDSTLRRLMQEFDVPRLIELGEALSEDESAIQEAKGREMRIALQALATAMSDASDEDPEGTANAFWEWLQGLRILNKHRELLGVQFRLDTLESRTLAFRDLVFVSSKARKLSGIFLLLDELEKQDGTLSATQVVRYLSAMRAIIDALPEHLFMLLAITPDALRRYSVALPAFRSRLQDKVELEALSDADEALDLAHFYVDEAKREGQASPPRGKVSATTPILSDDEITSLFNKLYETAGGRGDNGLRQREFLHALHLLAEQRIQSLLESERKKNSTKTPRRTTRKRQSDVG